ncbi:glycosyltransferase [Parabacteroides sp. OttesenSCG-928-G06]|nr:glycosyltransferase [Parabacteroides sp. OttesenSCG-928-G06]
MTILILNPILFTAEKNVLPQIKSIKDSMIYNFASGFVQSGHKVTLIAGEDFRPTEEESYEFEVIFVKTYLKSLFKVSLLPLPLSLWSFLKSQKDHYDLIISSESFSFTSLFASLIAPSKLVIWHELFVHNKLFFKIPSLVWYNVIVRLCYRKVCVIPRSRKAALFISKYARNVSETYVEHGIKTENFIPFEPKEDQFVVVSRLVPGKRIDRIILNFKRFIDTYTICAHYKLLLIGKGEAESTLRALVHDLHLEEKVLFCGFLSHDKLYPMVSRSKALLIDTERDLNMVSIPESVVAGTPVLANTQPGSSYYIEQNDLGIIKDDWDEKELKRIVDNNNYYSLNCQNYRNKLSNVSVAGEILNIFNHTHE